MILNGSLIIGLAVLLQNVSGQAIYKHGVEGLVFGEVDPTNVTRVSTCHFMDADRFVPGNLLYINGGSRLETLDPQSKQSKVAIPNLKLRNAHSFLQLDRTSVVIPDTYQFCVRLASRDTLRVDLLAGTCGVSGFADGPLLNAKFGTVYGITRLPQGAVVVADYGNKRLRKIDMEMESVTTLVSNLRNNPLSVAYRWSEGAVYFSMNQGHGLGTFNILTNQLTYLTPAGSPTSLIDGPILSSLWHGWPISIRFLTDKVMMVADQVTTMRVFDLAAQTTSSLCQGNGDVSKVKPGDIDECVISSPQSMATLPGGKEVYLGSIHSIGKVAVTGCAGYTCKDGSCIPYSWYCDYITDCSDGDDEMSCKASPPVMTTTLPVNQTSDDGIRHTLEFTADYKVDCGTLNDTNSYSVILDSAREKYGTLEDICDKDCSRPTSNGDPVISCGGDGDEINVRWPTNLVFGSNILDIPVDQILNGIEKKILTKGDILDITVPSHIPPVVLPIKTASGASVRVILTTSCTDGRMYSKADQTCV